MALAFLLAGIALIAHGLARAKELTPAEREAVVQMMRDPRSLIFRRSLMPKLQGPESVVDEFIYGVGALLAAVGGLLFWPA